MVYFKLKTSDWYPWLFYRVFLVQISIHTLCLSFMILRFLSNRQKQFNSKDELQQCEIHRQVVRRHMHCIWNTDVAAWLHLGNNLVRIFWACSIWQSWPAHGYGIGWWPMNSPTKTSNTLKCFHVMTSWFRHSISQFWHVCVPNWTGSLKEMYNADIKMSRLSYKGQAFRSIKGILTH